MPTIHSNVEIKYVATFRIPTHGLTSVMLVSITEEGGAVRQYVGIL